MRSAECVHVAESKVRSGSVVDCDDTQELLLLRTLVKELQSKNQILEENNCLLREKVSNLEEKLKISKDTLEKHKRAPSSENSVNKNISSDRALLAEVKKTTRGTTTGTKNTVETCISKQSNASLVETETTDGETGGRPQPPLGRKEENWQLVDKKNTKKKSRPTVMKADRPEPLRGEKETLNLKAATRMSTLFVSGVVAEATSENILNYLKDNDLHAHCKCDKMKTKNQNYYTGGAVTLSHLHNKFIRF